MDKRKRIITIIVLLILATAIVLGLLWFLSRRTAEKNGTQPLSFRKFLGFETKSGTPGDTIDGGLGSDFTDNGQNQTGTGNGTGENSDTAGGSADGTQGTNSSQFTNSTMSPDGSTDGSGTGSTDNGNSGTGTNGGNGNSGTNGTGTDGTGPGAGGGISGNGTNSNNGGIGADDNGASGLATTENKCSAADVNITFTPEELAKLQVLQDRFYAVAQTLHTDADTATQLANYENFKTKGQYFTQLLQYCQNTTPTTGDPAYTNRVPTPFWYKLNDVRDSTNVGVNNPLTGQPFGTTGGVVPLGYLGKPGQIGGSIDSVYRTDLPNQGPANGLRSIEQVLRLNLW